MPYKNNARVRVYRKELERRHRLTTTGHKRLSGTKRPYPYGIYGICELCNKPKQRLDYHHYDDNDLSKGVWLCSFCHRFAEAADKGYSVVEMVNMGITVAGKRRLARYIKLKMKIMENKRDRSKNKQKRNSQDANMRCDCFLIIKKGQRGKITKPLQNNGEM